MKRRHIAVVTQLGNGHVYPVLPLCSELVRRGHCVTYVTSNHYAKQVDGSGAKPVIFNIAAPDERLIGEIEKIFRLTCADAEYWQAARAFQKYQFSSIEQMLAQVQSFYERNAPDLILYDAFAIGGRVLANRLDCPVVRISPHFAQYEKYYVRGNGVFINPPGVTKYRQDLDSFLLSHGIRTEDNLWYTEAVNIHLIPKEFQYCNSYFDERFCFVGALMNRSFKRAWKSTTDGRPIVLISDLSGLRGASETVKSYYLSYYRLFINSLSESECHCILSIGDHIDPQLVGPLPSNFEINQRASHLEILPRAALLICHGGMLSTLEALYNGVPVLSIPNHEGTEEVAYRTQELGVGKQISKGVLSTEMVKESVEEMLSDASLRTRVTAMQQVFRGSGGAGMAADRIEQALS